MGFRSGVLCEIPFRHLRFCPIQLVSAGLENLGLRAQVYVGINENGNYELGRG